MTSALNVKDLKVTLGDFQLKQIQMDLPEGTVMGLIGRNGAGKTTFIKSILNLYQGTGTIRFYDQSLEHDHEEVCRNIAYVGVDVEHSLNSRIATLKKLYQQFYPDFDGDLFDQLCANSGISSKAKLMQLSLGQMKLYQLYMAICRKPKLLILDEPMANLDPITRREITDLLSDFMLGEDHAILISSHLLTDLEKIIDYVTLIDEGEVVLQEEMVRLQAGYYEVTGSKEEFDQLKPSMIKKMKRHGQDYKALCQVDDTAELRQLRYQRADLETLMYYYCERK